MSNPVLGKCQIWFSGKNKKIFKISAEFLPSMLSMKKANFKQEAYGLQFTHLSETAIAYLQMPCNILPVLPQQLGQNADRAV